MDEHVILVDEQNRPIGTCAKHLVHQRETPLHRGFSLFLFDGHDQLLLQQRSGDKQTWPLVWSNSCCGHPQEGEELVDAIRRRLRDELGIGQAEIYEVLPDYRYRASHHGTMENEFCPVWAGWSDCLPTRNPSEVAATRWVDWQSFVDSVLDENDPTYNQFSDWCLEETQLLAASSRFQSLRSLRRNHGQAD